MLAMPSKLAGAAFSLSLVLFFCIFSSFSVSTGSRTLAKEPSRGTFNTSAATNVDLKDYGAVGNGVADDAPALQEALDDLAAAGGGTLNVPAGKYRLATPVSKEFPQTAQLIIKGVPSSTPIVVIGNGKGLDLTSEFIIAVGATKDAVTLKGLDSVRIEDVGFTGVVDAINDARVVLNLSEVDHVTIQHCEFYGLASLGVGGAIVWAHGADFILQQTAFLGCATNSGTGSPIVKITSWHGVLVRDVKFVDYGERGNFFSKTPLQSPYSWILVGDVADLEPAQSRREVIMENVFMDEGGFFELAIRPDIFSIKHVPFDVYLSRLNVNVNNLFSDGVYIFGARRIFIDRSRFGWSVRAGFAITLNSVGDAILDLIETFVDATRLRASANRLTVINSSYTSLDSTGPYTKVIETDTAEEDPAQYVRQRYLSVLSHDPDAAGHFFWTDKILRCEGDQSCVSAAHAALDAFLTTSPAAKISVRGKVVDRDGAPLSGVTMTLTGSQSIAMVTSGNGEFNFGKLATAGEYQITPTKTGYTFESRTLVTPSADVVMNPVGTLISPTISGQVTSSSGPIAGAVLTLSGAGTATTKSDAQGNYSFPGLTFGGNYTITASRENYVFAQPNQFFFNLTSNQSGGDFLGVIMKYTVSGILTKPDGARLAGASVTISDGSSSQDVVTNHEGFYFFTVEAEADYVVSATSADFVFVPPRHTFTKLSANARGDFTSVDGVSLKVSVTTDTGDSLSGVVLSITGSEMKTGQTNSNGDLVLAVLPEGDYVVTPSKPNFTFSPGSITVNDVKADQTLNFTAAALPTTPTLISAEDPTRALALDAVLLTPEPFRLNYEYPWSADTRTRLVLFVTSIDLGTTGNSPDVKVELEDSSGQVYPLTVEYAARVTGLDSINRIIVRLHDDLTDVGDMQLRVTYKGLTSEPLRLGIGHIGP